MICEKKKCTGCFACFNKCPKHAIKMIEDDNGFLYPQIDKNKCINCNLCKKICPRLSEIKLSTPLNCFAMVRKDFNLRRKSTSGGAAAVFSEYILNNNGVVFGSAVKNNKICHIRIDTIEKLELLRGSKYTHSYIECTFNEVLNDLKKEIPVLFIGTPCQVVGLKKFLVKEYSNLYTIDIICHGVPSQKYLIDELKESSDGKFDSISFRDSNEYKLCVKNRSKIIYKKSLNDSNYYDGFMKGLLFRENCYSCPFSTIKRCSDMTIGDFWGIKDDSKFYVEKESGISLLLPITEKGMKLINENLDNIEIEERKIEEAIKGNSQLQTAVKMPKNYYKFKKDYVKLGFKKAYIKNNLIICLKRCIKRNKLFKKIIRKMK